MKPRSWGPFVWYLIHSISYNIDDDEYFTTHKKNYINLMNSLKFIIPCPICRGHYSKHFNKSKISDCNTKDEFIEWTVKIHNLTNKKLKKKEYKLENFNNNYKDINKKKILKALDILAMNFQFKYPVNKYKMFFESLRVVFPIKEMRIHYQNAMKKNKIKVNNFNSLVRWYINLGRLISKMM